MTSASKYRHWVLTWTAIVFSATTAKAASLSSGDYTLSVGVGASTRPYILHVPSGADNEPMPLLMMLHGAGGSADGASRAYGWREKADREHFLAVFPQGLAFDPSRPASFLTNPHVWNDMREPMQSRRAGVDDVAYLSAVLDDVQGQAAVDVNRIYVTGFSNGAGMTFTLGVKLSDRIAAIAPVSSHCVISHPDLKRPVPTIYIVGTADPLNPIDGGLAANPWGPKTYKPPYADSLNIWLNAVHADPSNATTNDDNGVTTKTYHGAGGCPVIYITIDGQGHEWPGHRRVLPLILTGRNVTTFDATDRIWDFLKSQTLKHTPG
jgi:polyhydroxybutyrate depolymerase